VLQKKLLNKGYQIFYNDLKEVINKNSINPENQDDELNDNSKASLPVESKTENSKILIKIIQIYHLPFGTH
jgi:hypothetical protein